jgi:predicted Zn-dependent peptidase
MQIKSISYHRVINLGNYESKRLELFAEIQEGEDPEAAISSLAELVERKAKESFELIFDIKELKRERKELSQEVERLKTEKDKLSGVEADPDNIPFDQMTQAQLDEINKNF